MVASAASESLGEHTLDMNGLMYVLIVAVVAWWPFLLLSKGDLCILIARCYSTQNLIVESAKDVHQTFHHLLHFLVCRCAGGDDGRQDGD